MLQLSKHEKMSMKHNFSPIWLIYIPLQTLKSLEIWFQCVNWHLKAIRKCLFKSNVDMQKVFDLVMQSLYLIYRESIC